MRIKSFARLPDYSMLGLLPAQTYKILPPPGSVSAGIYRCGCSNESLFPTFAPNPFARIVNNGILRGFTIFIFPCSRSKHINNHTLFFLLFCIMFFCPGYCTLQSGSKPFFAREPGAISSHFYRTLFIRHKAFGLSSVRFRAQPPYEGFLPPAVRFDSGTEIEQHLSFIFHPGIAQI